MAVDARMDPATRSGAIARVGGQLGINAETLRNWVTQAEIDGGTPAGTTTDEAKRIAELEREVRELGRADDILAFRPSGVRPPTEVVVEFIDAHKDRFGVEPICRVL